MSQLRSTFVAVFAVAAIGALVAFASRVDGSAQPEVAEEAVALALQDHYSEFLEYIPFEDEHGSLAYLPLCVETAQELDFERLNAAFADGKIVAEPLSDCSIVEPDDAEPWTGFPQYFQSDGEEGGHVEVDAECVALNRCIVEVDVDFRRDRYVLVREGPTWRLLSGENIVLRNIVPLPPPPGKEPDWWPPNL